MPHLLRSHHLLHCLTFFAVTTFFAVIWGEVGPCIGVKLAIGQLHPGGGQLHPVLKLLCQSKGKNELSLKWKAGLQSTTEEVPLACYVVILISLISNFTMVPSTCFSIPGYRMRNAKDVHTERRGTEVHSVQC